MASGLWLLAVTRVSAGNFYAGTSPTNVPWPGGIVPYEFTNSLTTTQQVTYLDGLREWELAAKVKFVPHTNQPNWILFTYNTNFIDYVAGGSRSPQVITISSLSRAQVCHEMGHSFGFNHENIRPDATNYITVLTSNITDEPANIVWFTPDPTTVTNGNYDYESVMHLGWDFDSTNPGVLRHATAQAALFSALPVSHGQFLSQPRRPRGAGVSLRPARRAAHQRRHHHRRRRPRQFARGDLLRDRSSRHDHPFQHPDERSRLQQRRVQHPSHRHVAAAGHGRHGD